MTRSEPAAIAAARAVSSATVTAPWEPCERSGLANTGNSLIPPGVANTRGTGSAPSSSSYVARLERVISHVRSGEVTMPARTSLACSASASSTSSWPGKIASISSSSTTSFSASIQPSVPTAGSVRRAPVRERPVAILLRARSRQPDLLQVRERASQLEPDLGPAREDEDAKGRIHCYAAWGTRKTWKSLP